MAESHVRKITKYQLCVEQCKMTGWQVHCDPTEIGCRVVVAQSLCKALSKFRFAGRNKMILIRLITDAMEKASSWLWIKRASSWQPNISTK